MIKSAIVTGGLGFIGSHLCNRLRAENISVIVIDNQINSVPESKSELTNLGCTIHEISIEDICLDKLPSVDVVFHLASIVGPVGILNKSGILGCSIVNNTHKLTNWCIETGALFVDISTSEIFGIPGVLNENSNRVFFPNYTARNEYAAAKLLAEVMISQISKQRDLKYHIIRPFNVAGPKQKPDGGFVLPRFVISILTGQPITIYWDGSCMRAFTDVRDICEGIMLATKSSNVNEDWNLGNQDNKMTILDLAKVVINEANKMEIKSKSKIIFIDPRTIFGDGFTEANDKIPDSTKAKNTLSWIPKYSLEQTVQDTLLYYKKRISDGYTFNILRA